MYEHRYWPSAERVPAVLLVLEKDRIVEASAPLPGVEALEGQRLVDLVPEGHRGPLDAALKDALHPGLGHRLDVPIAAPGRGLTWHLAAVGPHGEGRVLVVLTDITERRREEERLRRSERLMVDTEGTAHLGTWEWDISQPHAVWSEGLYRIYGLDPKTHVPTYQDYLTRVHPDDVERVKAATERAFHEHVPYSHDERIRHADGSWRYLHTWAHPVLDDGRLVSLVGVCQDVTERRLAEVSRAEAEARARAVLDGAPVGIGTLGPDGRFRSANPELQRLLGRAEEALLDLCLTDCMEPTDRRLHEGLVEDVVRGGRSPRFEVRLLRPHGGFWARLRLARADAPGGAFAVLFVEDTTQQREAHETERLALERMLRITELELLSERRGRLLSLAGHELKNPLTPILLQLQLLRRGRRGELGPEQAEAVESVTRQVKRLSRLVGDVLEAARLDQDRLALRPEPTDLAPVLERVQQAMTDAARQWDVELRVRAEGPLQALADGERVEQVLHNLVGNALKFTPRRGHVEVGGQRMDDVVHLWVRDDGPGLGEEAQLHVFDAFTRLDTPGREPGTGLGLFIAKTIVQAHGGSIWVESKPGAGATFHVRLPAA